MGRASVLAFATTIVCAGPALAETAGQASVQSLPGVSRLAGEPPTEVSRRGFSFPIVQYQEADGTIRVRHGIIAGKLVAPGTMLGLGLWETAPKARGYVGDVPQNMPRRSRRAAVGLSWKF